MKALDSLDAQRIDEKAGDTETSFADLITGILLHDTYHAGQIQLMKRFARSAGIGDGSDCTKRQGFGGAA